MSKLSWLSEQFFPSAELSALLPSPSLTVTCDNFLKKIILIKNYFVNKDINHLSLTTIHLLQSQCCLHWSVQLRLASLTHILHLLWNQIRLVCVKLECFPFAVVTLDAECAGCFTDGFYSFTWIFYDVNLHSI